MSVLLGMPSSTGKGAQNAGAVYTMRASEAKPKARLCRPLARVSRRRRAGHGEPTREPARWPFWTDAKRANEPYRMDIGGYLWLIIDVLFVVALAAAIIWGTQMWRKKRRDRATKQAEREAVDRVYREE